MKICLGCGENKSLSDFHNLKKSKDGKQRLCKLCAIATMQAWKSANPQRYESYNKTKSQRMTLNKHGIPWEDWEDLYKNYAQNCSICGIDISSKVFIDHDHSGGAVRGFLCNNCNSGLGFFKDSIEALNKAIMYLESPPLTSREYFSEAHTPAATLNGWKAHRKPREHASEEDLVVRRLEQQYSLCSCGQNKLKGAALCKPCFDKSRVKISWPSTENLIAEVQKTSYTKVGKRLGVSDNAVRKRIRNHPLG